MSVSITLSDLSWSAPDGRPVFSNINLNFGPDRTGLVGRNGIGKTTLFKLISGELTPRTGNVRVEGTLGVMRQVVQVGDETIADLFDISAELDILRRAETGAASAEELAIADWTMETRFTSALSRIGLEASPDTPLAKLSGGQRTRAGLAALVFAEPEFLLLDEPTNNLDREGRRAVIALLESWRSGAIVISHDRELLESVDAVVELTSLGATRFGGGWSYYRERRAIELAAAKRDLAFARQRVEEVARTMQKTAERKARRDAAGKRKQAKGDMPRILIGQRRNRSENTAGNHAQMAERLLTEAQEDASLAGKRIEILQPVSVLLAPTGLPGNRTVMAVDALSFGYDPGSPALEDVSLTLTGPERIAVTGGNGCGKTTFLSLVTGGLRPWSGSARIMTDFALLDQQLAILDRSLSIRDNFQNLNPDSDENTCRAALARFMFRSDSAMQTVSSLSGGELLRAALACVIGGQRPPQLLILDEPTNHLDIVSMEAVEAGLRAYDGALLIISHDEAFLEAIGISRRICLPGKP